MSIGFILVMVLLVAILVGAIAMFNTLVALRQKVANAWAQVDVQLKRRYDLIPNLVETVKGYMAHEKDTLDRVITARSSAMNASGVGEKSKADGELSGALMNLFAVAESYPELRANENMLSLQEELKSTENKIAFARQFYNDSATNYNTKVEQFPWSIFASSGGFRPRELYEIEDPGQREAVKVQF